MISLYNKENIEALPEPITKEALYVRDFFLPVIKSNSTEYIHNVKTQVALLVVDDIFLPVAINDEEYENAYVASLYSHYISYAIEEMYLLQQPLFEKLLTRVVNGVGHFLKFSKINKVIYVNNWLFSTNLQFNLTESQIKEITDFLTNAFPEHMLVFRSLSDHLHKDLMHSFKSNHYKELASRQVYIAKHWDELKKSERSNIKSDEKLLFKKGYELIEDIEPTAGNIEKVKALYDELYIDKYSKYNPMFTVAFYEHAMKSPLFKFKGISKDGELLGCIGYWQIKGVLTTPVLGYRVGLGVDSGLYRILSNQIFQETEKLQLTGHRSSGAANFKINRGAIASVEYSMIYNDHLSLKRRLGAGFLRILCNQFAVKLLKDKQL